MKSICRYSISFLTILLNVMLIAQPAQAWDNDAKVYPGSMCVRFRGADGDNVNLSYSRIGNPSETDWLYVDCPVINDEDGDGTLSGWFRAVDQNYFSGHNVVCSINSFYQSGAIMWGWWTASKATTENGNHVQHVSFSKDLGANGVSHYYFGCRIPPKYYGHISYINAYQVNED